MVHPGSFIDTYSGTRSAGYGSGPFCARVCSSCQFWARPRKQQLGSLSYEFGKTRGLRPFYDDLEYLPPDGLKISRSYLFGEDGPKRFCQYEIPACGEEDVVDSCDLKDVLLDEHVLHLWPEEGEQVLGLDSRPMDGFLFSIRSAGKGTLSVGELCVRDDPECSDQDQAVRHLRRLFSDLEQQALASPGCENLGL